MCVCACVCVRAHARQLLVLIVALLGVALGVCQSMAFAGSLRRALLAFTVFNFVWQVAVMVVRLMQCVWRVCRYLYLCVFLCLCLRVYACRSAVCVGVCREHVHVY